MISLPLRQQAVGYLLDNCTTYGTLTTYTTSYFLHALSADEVEIAVVEWNEDLSESADTVTALLAWAYHSSLEGELSVGPSSVRRLTKEWMGEEDEGDNDEDAERYSKKGNKGKKSSAKKCGAKNVHPGEKSSKKGNQPSDDSGHSDYEQFRRAAHGFLFRPWEELELDGPLGSGRSGTVALANAIMPSGTVREVAVKMVDVSKQGVKGILRELACYQKLQCVNCGHVPELLFVSASPSRQVRTSLNIFKYVPL